MSLVGLLVAVVCVNHVNLFVGSAPGAVASEERIPSTDIELMEKNLEEELATESEAGTIYLNEWAAEIPAGREIADIIANDLGYRNLGQIGRLTNHFLFEKIDHPGRSKRSAEGHTRTLISDSRVLWAEQQRSVRRVKRDVDKRQEARAYRNVRYTDEKWDKQWYLRRRRSVDLDERENPEKKAEDLFTDDLWNQEWYLLPDAFDRKNSLSGKMDLHVVPVWDLGITGKGVTVTVLDDGLEIDHPDLAKNYSPEASYDYNDDDDDPTPRYDKKRTNKHGTRCAGEIAMVANNGICGVGVAYDAKIGGIRMLDGIVTDRLEALALNHGLDVVDVYSASWGPNDNGETVEGPAKLATKAFEEGITNGRGGKGVIYVWASGNGGSNDDNCDCDGYTGSIYTISISSASHSLTSPWYAEMCASTVATTYSSGAYGEQKIVSTDINGQCTNDHTGTSASAPLAAGIIALLLQKHPELTWRDVQHLVVWTSEYEPLSAVDGWHQNGAGFMVNSKFGFGLLNAYSLIKAADESAFKAVPAKSICTVATDKEDNQVFPVHLESGEVVKITLETSGCQGQDNEINYVEHVQLYIDMTYSRRGALEIWLLSPSGTNTTLLTRRKKDHSTSGFTEWPFMSVHTWGETPQGQWTVGVADLHSVGNSGDIKSVTLVLHGTKTQPWHVKHAGGKRQYNREAAVTSTTTTTATTTTTEGTGNVVNPEYNSMPTDERDMIEYGTKNPENTSRLSSTTPSKYLDMDLTRYKFQQSIDELRKYLPRLDLNADVTGHRPRPSHAPTGMDPATETPPTDTIHYPEDGRDVSPPIGPDDNTFDDLFKYPDYRFYDGGFNLANPNPDKATSPFKYSLYVSRDWLDYPVTERLTDPQLIPGEGDPVRFLGASNSDQGSKSSSSGSRPQLYDALKDGSSFNLSPKYDFSKSLPISYIPRYDPDTASADPADLLDLYDQPTAVDARLYRRRRKFAIVQSQSLRHYPRDRS